MLYITYNASGFHNDGLGAQYQRMIAIFSLCHYLKSNIEYVHSPITKIEHISSNEEIQQIEDYFGFSKTFKNANDIQYDECIELNVITDFKIIVEISKKCKEHSKKVLLKTAMVFAIVEKYIYMYENAMIYLRTICLSSTNYSLNHYNKHGKNEKHGIIEKHGKNVAVHIRRGDVTTNTTNPDIMIRYTPTEYFKNIILYLQKEDPNRNFDIFTELTEQNKSEFDIFKNIPKLEIISNNNTLLTFQHLITADILVTCKSSFSYISAFYNPNTIYYLPFWHKPLSHWKKLSL